MAKSLEVFEQNGPQTREMEEAQKDAKPMPSNNAAPICDGWPMSLSPRWEKTGQGIDFAASIHLFFDQT
jgi:hypothetical protein